MITSINSGNVADYLALFELVNEYLMTHDAEGRDEQDAQFDSAIITNEEDKITSIDELMGYMYLLRTVKPQLTRLPLDEEPFFVDANTRVITVPPVFAKNGLSVQGDEIAESVYFKINRYVGHTDLATRDIWIQYENAVGDKGVSIPPVVDLDSAPGFIIFEWPICSKVTAVAGKIKFSIRFFKFDVDTGEVEYSLSSLPATAEVKAGQNFDIASIKDSAIEHDHSQLMKDRLQGGVLYEGGDKVDVEAPTFLDGFTIPATINLGLDADGFTTLPVTLDVQAFSTDGGQVSYKFYKNGENITAERELIPTEDTAPVENKLYYYAIKDAETGAIVGQKFTGKLTAFDADKEYYERVGKCTIDEVGEYYAVAINTIKKTTAEAKSPANDGDVVINCVVPEAKKPSVEELAKDVVIVYNSVKGDNDIAIASHAFKEDAGKLTYKWFGGKAADAMEELAGEVGPALIVADAGELVEFDPEDDEQAATAKALVFAGLASKVDASHILKRGLDANGIALGEGFYKVEVTNNLNKTSQSIESSVCRALHPAVRPTVTVANSTVLFADATSKGLSVVAEIPAAAGELEGMGELSYKWYRYKEYSENSLAADTLKAREGYLESKTDGDIVIDSEIGVVTADGILKLNESYNLSLGNIFYCEVTNKYGTTEAKRYSEFFTVNAAN